MKAKNKNDLLESLLAEIEPSDLNVLDYTYITAGTLELAQSIINRANERNHYLGIRERAENQQVFNMISAFQIGYMMGKREERLKRKILKAHAGTF